MSTIEAPRLELQSGIRPTGSSWRELDARGQNNGITREWDRLTGRHRVLVNLPEAVFAITELSAQEADETFQHPFVRREAETERTTPKMMRWNDALDAINSLHPLDRAVILKEVSEKKLGVPGVIIEKVEKQRGRSLYDYKAAAQIDSLNEVRPWKKLGKIL